MIHARKDYMRIQDPAMRDASLLGPGCKPIDDYEPVMLFRAQDILFISVLEDYKSRLARIGAEQNMLDAIDAHIKLAAKWQSEHRVKIPDIP
jgi:hypothetical protein